MTKSIIGKEWKYYSAVCGFAGVLVLFAAPLLAGSITDQVRATVEKMMFILQNAPGKPIPQGAEPSALREVFLENFDITDMAKRSLGPNWKLRTPKEQSDFVTLFTYVLENTYLHAVKDHAGGKFVCLREIQDGEFAEVMGKIVGGKGPEFPVSFKLHAGKQGWKVYDVMIDNMSLVNYYRVQFDRLPATAPFGELAGRIQEIRNDDPSKVELNKLLGYLIAAQAYRRHP